MKGYAIKLALIVVGALSVVLLMTPFVFGAGPYTDNVQVDLTVQEYLSMCDAANVGLGTIIVPGDNLEGTSSCTVTTNNDNGYNMTAEASGAPAMTKGADSFADYVNGAPAVWSVAANESRFGFSAEGPSTPAGTWGTPSLGSGLYRGFDGGNAIQIANNNNETAAETTTVYFRAQVGASYLQPSGAYSATVTLTTVTNP